MNSEAARRQRQKTIVMICIIIPVALLHFVTGKHYAGPCPDFVNGYLIDIVLPFALYMLLAPQDAVFSFMKPWTSKALPVLAIGYSVETLQYFGVPLFGKTFDPLDYLAYTAGIAAAVLVDRLLFPRIFPFWSPQED